MRLLALALILVGCHFDASGVAAGDDVGGIDAGSADASLDAPACVPQCLDANTLDRCDGLAAQTCPDGCAGGPGDAHCVGVQPSNGLDPAMLDGVTGMIDVANGELLVFDTGTGVIFDCGTATFVRGAGQGLTDGVRFQVLPPLEAGGAAIGVFAVTGVHLHGGGHIIAIGANAFAVLASGEIRLDDQLEADGGFTSCSIEVACGFEVGSRVCEGPGGFTGGAANMSGRGPGGGVSVPGGDPVGMFEFGGGGGGFGGAGAQGGSLSGGAGGAVYGDLDCEPLIGGGGGGGGGQDGGGTAGLGGGGGGAVQLTSLTKVKIGGNGAINVGAEGGGEAQGTTVGGGGGGAGGAILLEAPVLDLDGIIAANGGGGGAGNGLSDGVVELDGDDGALTTTPALGGAGSYPGGNGGAGMTEAQPGEPMGIDADGTGGGGGGVGRICLVTVDGGLLADMLVSSPAANVALDFVR